MTSREAEGPPAELELGHVLGAFGVRGEVRVFLHNPSSTLFADGRDVVMVAPDGSRRRIHLRTRSGAGKRILARIDGLTDRDEAASLAGHRLVIATEDLPPAEPDAFYVWALLGAEVRVGETVVGSVLDVQNGEHMDVLVVDVGEDEPVFIPCMARWIASIDSEAGVVVLADDALDEASE